MLRPSIFIPLAVSWNVGIPVNVNIVSGGKPNGIPERSDAGMEIVKKA